MKGTHDLRHGVLWKQILLFALPIAATSMLQQLFNSADVAVVGQFSAQKELALAAVGSTSSIVNLYITIFTGLAVGANVVIARLIGAEEEGDPELRYRQRYVDLIVNDGVKDTFLQRATVLRTLRSVLDNAGYTEVDRKSVV